MAIFFLFKLSQTIIIQYRSTKLIVTWFEDKFVLLHGYHHLQFYSAFCLCCIYLSNLSAKGRIQNKVDF